MYSVTQRLTNDFLRFFNIELAERQFSPKNLLSDALPDHSLRAQHHLPSIVVCNFIEFSARIGVIAHFQDTALLRPLQEMRRDRTRPNLSWFLWREIRHAADDEHWCFELGGLFQ